MFLYSLSVIVDQKIIVILLQYFNKMSDLGVFSVSFGLYEYTSMFPLILSSVLFPSVVRAHGKNETLYTKRRQYLSDIMVVMGLVVALGFFLLGDRIISTLFGDAYSEGKIYLKMLGFLCPILFFNMARLRWFVIEGLMHEWMILSFTCLVVNALLQLYALPLYGVKGGIIAVYLSIFIGNFLCSLIFHSIRTSAGVFLRSMFFWLRIRSLYNDLKKEI
jgi:O-antigen/teichoic acid export membrane protein